MNHEREDQEQVCPHCGEKAKRLGCCVVCGDPVCEFCGQEIDGGVKHWPEWCWSMPTPTRRK